MPYSNPFIWNPEKWYWRIYLQGSNEETYMQVRKQQLEVDIEQQIGSKSGKENVKAVYRHPVYLTLYAEYIM